MSPWWLKQSRTWLQTFSLFCLLFSSTHLQAQLCTGSLGDPVVNITFDTSGNSTAYVSPNAYTYTSSSCPNDGYYTITNATSNCFGNSWHTITNDHTGNGSFLLVNASYNPGDFMVTKVSGLCPNTTYEFAAWLMNVVNRMSILPNITFSIESTSGVVLQKINTGDIAVTDLPQWKQYGFYFVTPPTESEIVLRLTNNAPGGNGNDIALDDITFRPCGPKIVTQIQGHDDLVSVCEGQPNAFDFETTQYAGFAAPVYQWQQSFDSGTTWKDIVGANALQFHRPGSDTGIFKYRLTITEQTGVGIASCRIASNQLTIIVHPNPIVEAGATRTIIAGDELKLEPTVVAKNPSYQWTPPSYLNDSKLLDPVANPPSDQHYELTVTSAAGCTNSDNLMVKVVAGIFVPTAFTPNGDGLNDRWRIPYLDPAMRATVKVFNRYGQAVYEVSALPVDWDGKLRGMEQPSGTYIYHITFAGNKRSPMKGSFTLIR